MKQTLYTLLSLSSVIMGCSKPTPEQLAKQSCDCYNEAKIKKNPSNQIKAIENCNHQLHYNLSVLDDIGKNNDWTPEQVHEARKRFDEVYNKCNR